METALYFRSRRWRSEPYASYQLTNFVDDAVRNAFTSPIDNRIIFFADHQGAENYQIYTIDYPSFLATTPNAKS